MSDTKLNTKITVPAEQSIKKNNELELVITPKKEVLEWFKNTKGIIKQIDEVQIKTNLNTMECPNCKSQMLNYKHINEPGNYGTYVPSVISHLHRDNIDTSPKWLWD